MFDSEETLAQFASRIAESAQAAPRLWKPHFILKREERIVQKIETCPTNPVPDVGVQLSQFYGMKMSDF